MSSKKFDVAIDSTQNILSIMLAMPLGLLYDVYQNSFMSHVNVEQTI